MVESFEGTRSRQARNALFTALQTQFAEQLLTAHYCAFDRNTPLYVKGILVGALVYFVVPDRFIPKSLSLIAFADDTAVLAAAFKAVSSHIKPEHKEAAQRTLKRLRGEAYSRP